MKNKKKRAVKRALAVMGEARGYNKWLFSKLAPFMGGKVLEVGAGSGNMTEFLVKERGELWVTDVDKRYVKNLEKKFGERARVERVDIGKEEGQLPFGHFDLVVCFNVLEHVRDEKRALGNMWKWLKRGGKLVVLVPAHGRLYSILDKRWGHFRRYGRGGLVASLGEAGFGQIDARYANWIGALGWWLFVKLSEVGEMPEKEVRWLEKFGFLFNLAVAVEKWVRLPFGLSVWAVAVK